MFFTVKRITGILLLLLMLGVAYHYATERSGSRVGEITPESDQATEVSERIRAFESQTQRVIADSYGQPIEGFEPAMYLEAFPALVPADFDEVEAVVGHYHYTNNSLEHEVSTREPIHSAAGAISSQGMATLLENIGLRLRLDADTPVAEIVDRLRTDARAREQIACTADAKMCPDGSAVGRTGPDCTFAACPIDTSAAKDVTICERPGSEGQV
ncbi:hypothetical protein N9L26_02195, partial [Candidatus Pacebacteria bacterium]|nr:hypothetical protein [Candidatus Paceibacterota bacterium]